MMSVLRLAPHEYAHVLNENTNITELFIGPQTHTLASDERMATPVTPFHILRTGFYCIIENPHERNANGDVVRDAQGQVRLRVGEREVRVAPAAFPLYPGEDLIDTQRVPFLRCDEALVLRVVRTYTSPDGVTRPAGSRFFFHGPGTYVPRPEEEIESRRCAAVVPPGHALRLRAVETFTDAAGALRRAGEEYLWLVPGAYLGGVAEEIVGTVKPVALRPGHGAHVEVLQGFVDERGHARGTNRLAGMAYLVTHEECPLFFVHPCERIIRMVRRWHVSRKQYAVVVNTKTGSRRVVTNTAFYEEVGEELEGNAVCDSHILQDGQALLLRARMDFEDTDVEPPVMRKSGDTWLLCGPREYIPSSSVEICRDATNDVVRKRIVLNDGEGIYVRNKETGAVFVVNGPTAYMLEANEELWVKKLPPEVLSCFAECAAKANVVASPRMPYHTVMYKVPYRSVTQVYNYRTLQARIIFGPDRVLLEPDEEFAVVALSGSPRDPNDPSKCCPKESNYIKALHLFLGPSNMTDVVYVETRDHAQLGVRLCYAWYFDVAHGDEEAARKCFSVGDFVGDACSLIAGRIRAAVAPLPFEQFHKNSATLIHLAVFGQDPKTGLPMKELRFESNNFVISSVDTEKMTILDLRTYEGLKKSVKIAIEISTQAQEASAHQTARARDQQARGLIERQTTEDQVASEAQRKVLLEAEARSLSTATSGRVRSAAEAAAKAAAVEQNTALEVACIRAQKDDLMSETAAAIEWMRMAQQQDYDAALSDVAQELEGALEAIENEKFDSVMGTIGPDTVREIANAGPELQAKILESLGLDGYLVMDGSTPLNLFRTAAEMTGQNSA